MKTSRDELLQQRLRRALLAGLGSVIDLRGGEACDVHLTYLRRYAGRRDEASLNDDCQKVYVDFRRAFSAQTGKEIPRASVEDVERPVLTTSR